MKPRDRLYYFGRFLMLSGFRRSALKIMCKIVRKYPGYINSYKMLDKLKVYDDKNILNLGDNSNNPGKFCIFVGYPRSGHSLLSSLIDAHPYIAIADEFNVLQKLGYGLDKDTLFRYLEYNSSIFGKLHRERTGYHYYVPGQSQGICSNLKILGDKKGNATIRELMNDNSLLDRLEKLIGIPVYFIHVVRNPFDNIATWSARSKFSLEETTDKYFSTVNTIEWLRERCSKEHFIDIYHEEIIARPKVELKRVMQFLEIDNINEDYLNACASIVFKSPNKPSEKINWQLSLRENILSQSKKYKHLQYYN